MVCFGMFRALTKALSYTCKPEYEDRLRFAEGDVLPGAGVHGEVRTISRHHLAAGGWILSLNDHANSCDLTGFLPLHAATMQGHCAMYDYLVDMPRAEVCKHLGNGETGEMRRLAVALKQRSAHNWLPTITDPLREAPSIGDVANLSPLQLAAKMGLREMVEHILLRRSTVIWRWGDIAHYQLDLREIDSANEGNNNLLDIIQRRVAHLEARKMLLDDFFPIKVCMHACMQICMYSGVSMYVCVYVCIRCCWTTSSFPIQVDGEGEHGLICAYSLTYSLTHSLPCLATYSLTVLGGRRGRAWPDVRAHLSEVEAVWSANVDLPAERRYRLHLHYDGVCLWPSSPNPRDWH